MGRIKIVTSAVLVGSLILTSTTFSGSSAAKVDNNLLAITIQQEIQEVPKGMVAATNISTKKLIRVVIDNKPIAFKDQQPVIDLNSSRVLVPFRAIGESLGYDVEWLQATRQVKFTDGETIALLTVDSKNYTVNGVSLVADVAPFIYNNRTIVPVRVIAEAFKCDVTWDGPWSTVRIKTADSGGEGVVQGDFQTIIDGTLTREGTGTDETNPYSGPAPTPLPEFETGTEKGIPEGWSPLDIKYE